MHKSTLSPCTHPAKVAINDAGKAGLLLVVHLCSDVG